MKITHFSNSFMVVESNGDGIICDPWMGKANAGGWQSFPEFSSVDMSMRLKGSKWVYISHLHDDHYHPETLKNLGLLDREFIIKKFNPPIIRERLKKLGVKIIHEIEPFTISTCGSFNFAIFPQMTSNSSSLKDDISFDMDTSIVFKSEHAIFFNQVDNPLSVSDIKFINRWILDNLGKIDIACFKIGAASEYPHLYLGIDHVGEKQRIVNASLDHLREFLAILSPKYCFPAGGTYIIPGWLSNFSCNIAQPDFDEIKDYLNFHNSDTVPLMLEGGQCIDIENHLITAPLELSIKPVLADRYKAIMFHADDPYEYESYERPLYSELIKMLDLARHNWAKKIKDDKVTITQSIRFEIYNPLKYANDGITLGERKGSFMLNNAINKEDGVLLINIDLRAIYGCITKKCIWNGVLGSLCLFERRPNRHFPSDIFSINYFTLNQEQISAFSVAA
jgi:UDP-MurNAc hydroxylase